MMLTLVLKSYVYLHEAIHKRVISRLGCSIYGLHPKEIFGKRYEFFLMYVTQNNIVLDVACGTGNILYKIRHNIKRGDGEDYSESQIALCNKLHGADNLSYHKMDVINMDYKYVKNEVKYNMALFSHILEHVDDVPALLINVDADEILICVPSGAHWYRGLMEGLGLDIRTDRGHFREYTIDMLLKELEGANYHAKFAGYNSDGDIVCYAIKIR